MDPRQSRPDRAGLSLGQTYHRVERHTQPEHRTSGTHVGLVQTLNLADLNCLLTMATRQGVFRQKG